MHNCSNEFILKRPATILLILENFICVALAAENPTKNYHILAYLRNRQNEQERLQISGIIGWPSFFENRLSTDETHKKVVVLRVNSLVGQTLKELEIAPEKWAPEGNQIVFLPHHFWGF